MRGPRLCIHADPCSFARSGVLRGIVCIAQSLMPDEKALSVDPCQCGVQGGAIDSSSAIATADDVKKR